LEQITTFISNLPRKHKRFRAHINITGGEPFLFPHLLPLLQSIQETNLFSFGILSNGFLLPDQSLKILKSLNPSFIQLSLDGDKLVNDQLRGPAAFDETLKAAMAYKKLKIPLLFSFTANAMNYGFFKDVVAIAKRYKIAKVWTDRYLPLNKNDELLMSSSQTFTFMHNLSQLYGKQHRFVKAATKISCDRALQFLTAGGEPYRCQAGVSLLALMPNGDLYPCRRMPVILGNINSTPLQEIYQTSPLLAQLQTDHLSDQSCRNCFFSKSCNGGLKCLSYALYGDFTRKDPHCWIE
jgi:radical SAM protein with 4Fe4S-binding SPASM domain